MTRLERLRAKNTLNAASAAQETGTTQKAATTNAAQGAATGSTRLDALRTQKRAERASAAANAAESATTSRTEKTREMIASGLLSPQNKSRGSQITKNNITSRAKKADADFGKQQERVKNTVTGAGKQWVGSISAAISTLNDANQTRHDTENRLYLVEYARSLEDAKRVMEGMQKENAENPGSWSGSDIESQQYVIDNWQTKYDAMARVINEGLQQKTTQAAYEFSDELVQSGAEDIEKAKDGLGAGGRFAVDVATSTLQTLADAAATSVTALPMGSFALRSFGGGAQQARLENPDSTLKQQVAAGLATMAKEIATEKMFSISGLPKKAYGGGSLDDIVERAIGNAVERLATTQAGKDALNAVLVLSAGTVSEGLEELIGTWLESGIPRIYGGEVAPAEETLEASLYNFLVGAGSGFVGGVADAKTYHYDGKSKTQSADTQEVQEGESRAQSGTSQGSALDRVLTGTEQVTNRQAEAILADETALAELGEKTGLTITSEMTQAQKRAAVKTAVNALRSAQETAYTETANGTALAAESDTPQNSQEIGGTADTAPVLSQDDGEEVSRETVQRRVEQVQQAAGVLGENGSRALSTVYNEETAQGYASEDALRDFFQVYNAALNGKSDSNTTAPNYLRIAAQNAGERDARLATQAKYFGEKAGLVRDTNWKKAKLTRKESYALDALAKVTGTEIRFVESIEDGTTNAIYDDGVMSIALDAENPALTCAVHETVHRLRETAPEEYGVLARFAQENLSEESAEANRAVREGLYGEDADTLTEEIVADAFGTMLEKSDVLTQFVTEHRSTAQKLADMLHDLAVKISRALGNKEVKLSDNQRAAFRDLADKVGEMENLFTDALKAAQKRTAAVQGNKNTATEGGGTKFSLKSFEDGVRFVDVQTEQKQFDGLNDAQKSKKATQIIKNKFIGKVIGLDNRAFVNGKTASEYGHPVKRLTPEIVNAKMRASTELDNLVDAGTNFRTRPDGADGHTHPHAVGDFQYFDTIFKVGNEYYKGVVNIEPVSKGLRLKDITKIENITQDLYSSYGTNPKSVFLRDASMDSIGSKNRNVKPKYSLKTDSEGRKLTEAQEEYFKDSKVRDSEGRLKVVYHGTSRADRVGTVFRPERATSGPMAFFTDNADIAEHYSRDKADTSIAYDTDYDSYETQFRTAKNGGESISLIDAWRTLPLSAKRTIAERAAHVRIDMDGDGSILYDPNTTEANGGFSWQIKEARGNILAALNEQWLNSGLLYGDEGQYIDVLREAGVFDALEQAGYDAPKYFDPDYREEKVYTAYLNITNPFDAQEQATEQFLREFEDWYEAQDTSRYDTDGVGADFWDKNNVSAEDFVERVRDDIANGTSRAWTSIPGSVSDFLKESGYDGVVDKGGKNGGVEHTVYIPFSSEQVKNTDNLSPTDSEDIRYSRKTREALDAYVAQYGEMPAGEKPHRTVHLPQRTAQDKYVSQTIRTVLEAKATPDVLVPTIENMVAKGKFSFDRYTDRQAVSDAEEKIRTQGWQKSIELWKKATKNVVSKEAMATGWALYNNAANSGDVETALNVLNDIVGKSRNAAQALQATRLLKMQEPSAQLYGVQRTVEGLQQEINEKYGERARELKIDPELAEQFLNARTEEARDAALREIYRDIGRQMPNSFLDKWNAWRYVSMLANPRTHGKNIFGNAAFAPAVLTKDLVATALENVVIGKNEGRTKAVLTHKDGALLKAAYGDYANVRELALGEGKYNDRAMARKEIEEGRKIFGTTGFKPWDATVGRGLEAVRKVNSAALDTEDVWFSKPHYAVAMAQFCKANHITAEQIASGEGLEEARNYAIKEAQKATYRDANDFSQTISSLGRSHGKDSDTGKLFAVLTEGVLPFRKTPANVLVRGVEYSPLEFLKVLGYDIKRVQNGEMQTSEMLDDISTGLTGTGVMMLGIFLAKSALLRGKGGDDDKDEFEELAGHQDYSLELPNGTSITLDWAAPAVLPLFVGANLYETMKAKDGSLTMADCLTIAANIGDPLLEMSCLQGLNDLLDVFSAYSSGGVQALPAAVAKVATNYITQGLPTIFGQIERTFENKRYTTYTKDQKDSKWLTPNMQYTLGSVSGKVPGEFQQIPYIDAWGREESTGNFATRAFNNFINPSYTSKINESEMEQELLALYESTGDGSVFPSRAAKKFTQYGIEKRLTQDEYVAFAKKQGTTAYNLVTKITSSRYYSSMSDEQKVKAVTSCYEYARETARKSASSTYRMESWVEKASSAKRDYGIPIETYIAAKTMTVGISSLTNKSGDTISDSRGLQIMEVVYSLPGLNDEQRKYLFEALGVGKEIRHYNKALVERKLARMREKAK